MKSTRRMSESNKAELVAKQVDDEHSVSCRKVMMSNHKTKHQKYENILQWQPNVNERQLLRLTWSDEFEFLYELGTSIYSYIFENNPNCKQLFPAFNKYGDDWKESREFRAQALRFVQTISQVVKNIYHMDQLEPYLYNVGQRHCKFVQRGFKPEYWEVFQDAMEHSLTEHMNKLPELSDQQRIEAVQVWRTVALYITTHMKIGYFDGLKSINRHPPLT
ncbi:globin [Dictyocaulus viviparus]|uniref:Globin n=1 Tax=Dictyocaulus viviparus TaxID=29172 RepID=A0A0D8XU60_DICVI|nr:globin [Dictyocaulus viviparus]